MDYGHRQRIDEIINHFVQHVDIYALWPYLFTYRIYNRDDCNIRNWSRSIDDPETIRDIILTIKTRGPLAYHYLILSLRQTNQNLLADLLEIDTVGK